MAALVHFVGFRDDRYWNAVRVWGPPDFIHRTWDVYAANDVATGDIVILATGDADALPRSFTMAAQRRREERNAQGTEARISD